MKSLETKITRQKKPKILLPLSKIAEVDKKSSPVKLWICLKLTFICAINVKVNLLIFRLLELILFPLRKIKKCIITWIKSYVIIITKSATMPTNLLISWQKTSVSFGKLYFANYTKNKDCSKNIWSKTEAPMYFFYLTHFID